MSLAVPSLPPAKPYAPRSHTRAMPARCPGSTERQEERMPIITYAQAVASLRKAVDANGADFVYNAPTIDHPAITGELCVYFDENGAPSCIIGHVLHDSGVTLETIGDSFNIDSPISELITAGIIQADLRAELLLIHVQGLQDHGEPWGTAVDEAIASTQSVVAP